MEKGRDAQGPFMQMQCGIDDIRLMHTAINFYLENYPGPDIGVDPAEEFKHLRAFQKTFYSIIKALIDNDPSMFSSSSALDFIH